MIKILKKTTYRRMQREIMELRDTISVYQEENAKLRSENRKLSAMQPKRGSGGKFVKKSPDRK